MNSNVDYRRVFDSAHEAILLLDLTGEVIAASDGYLRGVGLPLSDVEGRALDRLPPYVGLPNTARQLREMVGSMRRSALPVAPVTFEADAASLAGLWTHATLRSVTNTSGQVAWIEHAFESTAGGSERSELDSERRLRKLIEHTYDAIALFDIHGRPAYVSPTIQRILGFTPAEFSAMNPIEGVHPDDRAYFGDKLSDLLAHPGGSMLIRFRARNRDGDYRTLENTGVNRLHDPDVAAIIATFRDVTEQAELQAERQRLLEERQLLELRAQESQKLESLGMLAGGIAHDFNNLLMVIMGGLSLLRRELGPDHAAIAQVEPMEEASRRATDLCRQLLAYAGKGRFVLERTNLNRLIEETTHLLQLSIHKKVALRFHLDPNLAAIIADATQMRQLLMNLVINASDAIGDRSGIITISTGVVMADRTYLETTFLAPDLPGGEYVFIEVSDTGCGMSAETQARIFEPFFTTKFTGRGLGLAAVLGIVRGHKGALKVYSEPDKGSNFRFLLPSARGRVPSVLPDAPAAEPAPNSGGTVLVVDDESSVRTVASQLLRGLGFSTLVAADGYEALRVYREHQHEIRCVLMDLTMPGLDGEEALRELRRIDPQVRVLLMSGYNEQDCTGRFTGRGCAAFIQKPFTLGELKQRLASLFE